MLGRRHPGRDRLRSRLSETKRKGMCTIASQARPGLLEVRKDASVGRPRRRISWCGTLGLMKTSNRATKKGGSQLWNVALLNVSVVALTYVLIWPSAPDKSRELWFYLVTFVVAPIIGAIGGSKLSESSPSRYFSYLLPPFCAIAAALVLLWSVRFLTIHNRYAFWWGCALTLAAGVWHLLRREGTATRLAEFLFVMAGLLVLLLLFGDPLRIDTGHNGPYLGPAVNVLHGGRPMLDVFSQYGMAYLVYALLIASSGYSLPAVVALISAFNLVYFGTVAFIAWKLASRRAIPFLFTVAGIVAIVSNYPLDINYTPSVW